MVVELDLSGASFSKQFKKANKLNSKCVVVMGDQEAANKEFVIRLFDKESSNKTEEIISFDNDTKLDQWLNNNLLSN